jgi:hypothetical protein
MASEKIKYLEHPVDAETKKEWCEKGYKIIDAVFEPKADKAEKPKADK